MFSSFVEFWVGVSAELVGSVLTLLLGPNVHSAHALGSKSILMTWLLALPFGSSVTSFGVWHAGGLTPSVGVRGLMSQ